MKIFFAAEAGYQERWNRAPVCCVRITSPYKFTLVAPSEIGRTIFARA